MGKETILFLKKDDRERKIRSQIKRFVPFFYDLNEVDPNEFDFVIPFTIYAQKYATAHGENFEKQKLFALSNHVFDVCTDKVKFHHFLIENGFENLAPRINEPFDYPDVLKKRVGAWGQDVFIISDPEIEQAHLDELVSEKFFTEEFIEG